MATQPQVDRLLAQGIASARAGQRAQACNLLLDVVELDRYNETAWLWLSAVTDNPDDQRTCLENVLTINPNNTLARQRLAILSTNGGSYSSRTVICPQCGAGNRDFVRQCSACGFYLFQRCPICGEFNSTDVRVCAGCGGSLAPADSRVVQSSQQTASVRAEVPAVSRTPVPLTIWPVVAFWVSVSIFFIGGGILSLLQFAGILLRARGVIQNLSPIQIAWLPMSLFFVVFGFTGVSLAWQLARRRSGGYYGSLLFGLILAVLGPSASMVLEPPNYVATIFTGLVPTAAVLLTVASLTGFEARANNP